jgi:hypothetical protein
MASKPSKRSPQSKSDALLRHLRERGLAKYPGSHLMSPWPGHLDLAVDGKTYAYLSLEGEPFGISCKLPKSSGFALSIPGTRPTPYGLGKSGWVSLSVEDGAAIPPLELLEEWLDESYRAQCKKRRLKELDGAAAGAKAKPVKPAKATKATKPAARGRAAKARGKPGARRGRPAR